jgi:hypothetical protein
VRQHRFDGFGMMLWSVNAATVRHAHDHRASHAPTGAMAQAAHMIDDLVDRWINKSHELYFGDGSHALRGHADAHPGNHVLRKRSVLHSITAKALEQPGGRTKHTATSADVFAQHDDARIVFELPGLSHRNGFDHRDLRHDSIDR